MATGNGFIDFAGVVSLVNHLKIAPCEQSTGRAIPFCTVYTAHTTPHGTWKRAARPTSKRIPSIIQD
jgi:hypothetical protein